MDAAPRDDRFTAAELERRLPARRRLARRILVLERCDSTQEEARRRTDEEAEALLVVADEQTAGRGRRGRAWWSGPPAANLALTLAVPEPPDPAPALTAAAACALAATLDRLGLGPTGLKWPNDVLLGGRKAAGVLGEVRGGGAAPIALLGMGVDVHAAPPDLPEATSLDARAHEVGAPPPRRLDVLAGWLWELEARLAVLERGGPGALEDEFLARLRIGAPHGVWAPSGGAARLLEFRFDDGLLLDEEDGRKRHPLARLERLVPRPAP